MLRYLLLRTVGRVVAWPIRRRVAAFERATKTPRELQERLLQEIIARQTDTAFGRDHHFASIRTPADFRKHVPVAPYEYVEPYIARERKGERGALIADGPILMFALTSGTTAARKYIPVTPRYLADYRRGWNIWGLRTYHDHRKVILRPIVQLAGDPDEFRTEAGIPCGNISGLTAQAQKRIVRGIYCVPPITGRLKDAAARLYVALRFSLAKQAGMVLSANPSTLVGLARAAVTNADALIQDLHDGTLAAGLDIPDDVRAALGPRLKPLPERARELRRLADAAGRLRLADAWPADRCIIGTWTGGSVGPYLRQLPHYYGDTPVRDLGLIASEGRMSLPVADGTRAGVLDVTTHYFEFIPEDEIDSPQPTVLAAHEVQEGRHYYILPTTAAGLYRYHICDLVKVAGFHNATPLVEFLGKGNRFANLTGEKLSEHQVTRAMDEAAHATGVALPASYTLSPCWDEQQPFYGLFVENGTAEGELRRLLAELDARLGGHNSEYQAKRDSQRLGPPRALLLLPGAWHRWDQERLRKAGGAPEQYKRPCLIGDVDFRATMAVVGEVVI